MYPLPRGSLVALVTPMEPDGSLDYAGLKQLIEMHLTCGTSGIVLLGTTGESLSLSDSERLAVIETTLKVVQKRLPIIVGTSSAYTAEAIRFARQAREAGADAVLSVCPYYYKPTQPGLYEHFKGIANAVPEIPVILYDVPARTASQLTDENIQALSQINNICGLKDATAESTARIARLSQRLPSEFALYSGDDSTAITAIRSSHAHGVISVSANLVPRMISQCCLDALQTAPTQTACSLDAQLKPLHQALFLESNPIPIKWALQRIGKIQSGIRLPLTVLSDPHTQSVETALDTLGLL